MSKHENISSSGVMLDLWRPPQGAGDPVGCLATTYTFAPTLFDEQCLGRFLEIESEPNREDLAFLLERETRLGSVYAGVLVDYTQAGVEHSLRWDVLPVRIPTGKQHAKISLLCWTRHVRIIVASANLTEPGYRVNHEIAAMVDLGPVEAHVDMLTAAVVFLRSLLRFVPGGELSPETRRAEAFLDQVGRHVQEWKQTRRGGTIRQQLVFTLPSNISAGRAAQSSLGEAVQACRGRGGSPNEARIASPFFDVNDEASRVAASLCKLMARGTRRNLCFCVPAIRSGDATTPRLAAPKALLRTPPIYNATVAVEILPEVDGDKNRRPWHAKMLALRADQYSAIMIGSSNFTTAGMGTGSHRNAEANLLTIVDRVAYGRQAGQLEAVWPKMDGVTDPESAEWLGAQPEHEEEEQNEAPPMHMGFLSATYRAGDRRQIVLRLDADNLPEDWAIHACSRDQGDMLSAPTWRESGRSSIVELPRAPIQPPEKLLVRWADHEAFLPLNVEDTRDLPPPAQLEHMSAEDMLWILASPDASAAFRAWAEGQQSPDSFDTDLDSATPIDLDPLRRYDLQVTFLRRIRHRARILAQMRSNVERPVWGLRALEWRLRGLVGIAPLADRLARELTSATGSADEALLSLTDFVIVLCQVDYQPSAGSMPKTEFDKVFCSFLGELAATLQQQIESHRYRVSEDVWQFWERMLERCRS